MEFARSSFKSSFLKLVLLTLIAFFGFINIGEAQQSPYIPEGYTLKFSDEFDGTTLDKTKWKTRYIYANETLDFLNDEQQRFRENGNHVVSDGTLKLIAKKVYNDGRRDAYESGMIRSTYTQRYGYIEARIKNPSFKGVWAGFWLNPDYGPNKYLSWPPEIDMMEYVMNGTDELADMMHSSIINKENNQGKTVLYADARYNTQWGYFRDGKGSFGNRWITVGVLWDPNTVTMFYDGKKVLVLNTRWVYASGSEAAPAHILLNLAIGGSWAGRYGVDDSGFPHQMEIDYVRAYQASGPVVHMVTATSTVTAGGSTLLTWSSTNATQCIGNGFPTDGKVFGTATVTPAATQTYSVTCSGQGTSVSANTTLTVKGGTSVPTPPAPVPPTLPTTCTVPLPAASESITPGTNSTRVWSLQTQLNKYQRPLITVNSNYDASTVAAVQRFQCQYGVICAGTEATTGYGVVGPQTLQKLRKFEKCGVDAPQVNISASSATVVEGSSAILTWSSVNASACVGTGFNTNNKISGSVTISPNATTKYSVSCAGVGMSTTGSTTVTVVPPPPTVSFSAAPSAITDVDSTTLTWSSTNADSCSGNGFSTGSKTAGSVTVSPNSNTTYTISCEGKGGEISSSALVTVTQAPSAECSVPLPKESESIAPNTTGTRIWSLQTQLNKYQRPKITVNSKYDAATVAAVKNFQCQYGIMCTGSEASGYGVVGQQTLQKLRQFEKCGVPDPTVSISASPAALSAGQSSVITWSSTNAASCTGTGFNTESQKSGSATVNPTASTEYSITCEGISKSVEAKTNITVNAAPSAKFSAGDRVKTTYAVNVRGIPAVSSIISGQRPMNALATVVEGPINEGGYTWWKLDYDFGVDGWSTETYLIKQ